MAGEDQEAIKPVISNLEKFGVGAILDYSVEEDLSENETKGQMGKNPDESLDPADEHAQYKPHVEFADRRKGVYSARTYFYEGEEECDTRLNTFLKCIDAAGIKDVYIIIHVYEDNVVIVFRIKTDVQLVCLLQPSTVSHIFLVIFAITIN